ncbi:hypothetical protein HD806DRAFT_305896 [Xylariaceae sp. AK1471]|nr:hypothetical protein HD806DRAFT_305896 [Xylariaceae sp. AK1471]
MDKPICAGNPTFNLAEGPSADSTWPSGISGYICKTPPFGIFNAPRFSECCSGKVYNITGSASPDDPAYPVSCATFCQIDPAFDERNPENPYSFSDYFMCLTNGGKLPSNWEVICATNSIDGIPAPTSFASTPTGAWMSATSDAEFTTTSESSLEITSTDTSSFPSSTSGPAASSTDVSTTTQMSSSSPTGSAALPTTTSAAFGKNGLAKRHLWTGLLVLIVYLA